MRGYLRGMVWGGVTGIAALSLVSVASDFSKLAVNAPEAPVVLPPTEAEAPQAEARPPRVYGDGSGTLPSLVPPESLVRPPEEEVVVLSEAPPVNAPELPPADLPQLEALPPVELTPPVTAPEAALPEEAPQIAPDLPQVEEALQIEAPEALPPAETLPPEVPVAEEAPVAEEPLAEEEVTVNEGPTVIDAPVVEDQSAAENSPAAENPPSVEVPPTVEEAPIVLDVPAVAEASTEDAAAEDAPLAEAPPEAEAAPILRPTPGFTREVEGVRTGQLPSITPEGSSLEVAPAADLSGSALQRNARPFFNPEGKPPFAILLIDDPQSEMDLATLAASDLPLTLVIDPSSPKSIERAALWHQAGQEVALLATALPKSSEAADLEVALEALAMSFPEALALVDPQNGVLQGDRALATALAPALAVRGYGLVTWEQGMRTADQVARREGLAAATIYRALDEKGEAAPVIRRYLDRAAFKAQQDGKAMVIGTLRPQTLQGVMEWALEGRASSLALAPLSAVVGTP